MARNRMIKPEFWDDEKLSKISRDARLTYIGLWNFSDDYGVVKGNPSWLKNHIYPYEDSMSIQKFTTVLSELLNGLWILPFDHNGETYFYIKNFLKHQTINRPSKQRNPTPPDGIMECSMSDPTQLIDEIKDKLNESEIKDKNNNGRSKDFEKFWEAYPVKKSKGQAIKTWVKLSKEKALPTIEKIIESIQEQTAERIRKRQVNSFVPEWKHPSSWLNAMSWEDATEECECEVECRLDDSGWDPVTKKYMTPDGQPRVVL